ARHKIEESSESDQAQPHHQQIVGVPPGDDGLGRAANRKGVQQKVRRRENPGKPKQGREQKPLGDVKLPFTPLMKGNETPYGNEQITQEKNERGIRGQFEILKAGGVAGE